MAITQSVAVHHKHLARLLLKVLKCFVILLFFHSSCFSQEVFTQVIPKNEKFTHSLLLKKKSFVKITIDSISYNRDLTFKIFHSTSKKSVKTENSFIEFFYRTFSENSNGDITSYYLLDSGHYVITRVLDDTRRDIKHYKKRIPETKLQIYSYDTDTLYEKLNLFSDWLVKTKMSNLYDLLGVFDLKKIDTVKLLGFSKDLDLIAQYIQRRNGIRPQYVIFLKNHSIAPHYWQGGRELTEFFYDKIISEISLELAKPKNSFFIMNPPRACYPNNVFIDTENKASLFGSRDACCAWCGRGAHKEVLDLKTHLSCAEIDISDLIKSNGQQFKHPFDVSRLMYDFKEFADPFFRKRNGVLQSITINKFGFDGIVRELKGEVVIKSKNWELVYISCTPSIIGSEGKIKLTISGGYTGGMGNCPADTNFDKAFGEIDCCNYAKALLINFQNYLNQKYIK